MKLNLVASKSHYLDHLLPIWNRLPDSCKGDVLLPEDGHRRARGRADVVSLVASYADVQRVGNRPVIVVEHGAGQSYDWTSATGVVADGSYSGGRGYQNAIGFVTPNEEVAHRWFSRYPNVPCAVVGSPRLDPWHAGLRPEPEERTVAITFHWDGQFSGVPETRSLFPAYLPHLEDALLAWRRQGWKVLGHWHPRYPALGEYWERMNREMGVEVVASSSEIMDRASVLVADNTSLQADFLSLGRPVVWLNHDETYRRNVEHGGRFWQWPQLGGQSVDSGASLRHLVLDDVPPAHGHPYAFADGKASERASLAIRQWLIDAATD